MEGNLYSNELLGDNKIRESLQALLKSSSVLNVNFGQIQVSFGEPISMKQWTAEHIESVKVFAGFGVL